MEALPSISAADPSSATRAWGRIAARWVIALAVLLCISNFGAFYEQDELAKASQVLSLAKEKSVWAIHSLPNYYRRDFFSAFYIASTLLLKASGLSPLQSITAVSVIAGSVFLALAPWLIQRLFSVSDWLAFAVLLSGPAFIVNFSYGNEAALALAAITVSACLLQLPARGWAVMAAAFYCLATFSRTDYAFLAPALALLALRKRADGVVDWKESALRVSILGGAAALLGLSYYLLVVKQYPDPENFKYHTDPKLFAAFVVFGAGYANIVGALAGIIRCLRQKRWKLLLVGVILVQAVPYLAQLTSPKYILPSLTGLLMFSALGFQWIAQGSRPLAGALMVLPWLVSFTPYGVFAGPKCALWYLPTDAGPIPTGGYPWMYASIKTGFYQKRYSDEIAQMGMAMPVISAAPLTTDLLGFFQPGSLRVWATERGRWDLDPKFERFIDLRLSPESLSHRKLMLKSSYLYVFKLDAAVSETITGWLAEGRVRRITSENGPFPNVIEVGPLVPPATDSPLGRRIIFMNQRSNGEQWVGGGKFVREYDGLSWVPFTQPESAARPSTIPVYHDAEWACYAENLAGGQYYSLRFPPVYASRRVAGNGRP